MNKDKEFIPYEQALELKELGFDELCMSTIDQTGYIHIKGAKSILYDIVPTPLFQQAFRWFRDKKLSDMCVCRYQGRDDGGVYYYYCITNDFGVEETRHFQEGFFTYEEAELACLKKLIEIVKKNF